MRRFSCPVIALAVFTDKLPDARGVGKAQLDRDSKDALALQNFEGPVRPWNLSPTGLLFQHRVRREACRRTSPAL